MAGKRGGLGAARGLAQRVVAGVVSGGASVAAEVKLMVIGVAVTVVAVLMLLLMVGLIGGFAAVAGDGQEREASGTTTWAGGDCPTRFKAIYESAAERFALGPKGVWVLASVHQVETNFGDGYAKSYAGALGPMQFMPGTWKKGYANDVRAVAVSARTPVRASDGPSRIVGPPTTDNGDGYATDGDGDGIADSNNVHDAIHSAARYLNASGAPGSWYQALFAYNRADWYVKKVLQGATKLEATCLVAETDGTLMVNDFDFNDTRGQWEGSMKFAKALANLGLRHGCTATSEKRPTRNTASGGVSDHWTGSPNSYAVDIAGCSLAFPGGPLDKTAMEIAAAIGLPSRTGANSITHGAYRFQMIWQSMVGGNHFDHVHIGVKMVRSLS